MKGQQRMGYMEIMKVTHLNSRNSIYIYSTMKEFP